MIFTAEAVKNAVKIGYRHFDTAQAYGNERGVGEGVRTAGIPREEIFVTLKVAAVRAKNDAVDAFIEKLRDMDSVANEFDENPWVAWWTAWSCTRTVPLHFSLKAWRRSMLNKERCG